MKKKLLFMALALALMVSIFFVKPTTASAAEYTSGDYTYTVSGNQATITGIKSDLYGTVTIPSSLGGYPVGAIGRNAFKDSMGIKTLIIPDTVTSIDRYAFYNCSGMTSLTIGSKVASIGYSAFEGCTGLKTVVIPNSVTEIGDEAFRGCTGLVSVTIGTGLIEIPQYCFAGCNRLQSVTIGKNVTEIGYKAFSDCSALSTISWGVKLQTISGYAFSYCTSLKNVTIPNTVTVIDGGAFRSCSAMASLTIGSKVTSIGYDSFRDCTALKSVTIPNSVTNMGTSAFRNCTSITSVAIGTGLLTIPDYCFFQCKSLQTLTIGKNVTEIGYSAFLECIGLHTINWGSKLKQISGAAFQGCSALKSLTIPDTVTTMHYDAFEDCSGIVSLTIGKYVTSIPSGAFAGCTGLKEVIIPESVIHIEGSAFSECSSITKIYLPVSLQTVASYAFKECNNITDVYYEGSTSDWSFVSVNTYGNKSFINATMHYNHYLHDYKSVVTYPTATKNGYTTYTCKLCGYRYVAQYTFPDVRNTAWYYNAVEFAVREGYVSGYKNGNFGPADAITRQDFVVILARIEGVNLSKYSGKTSFKDVPANSYYAKAIQWASSTGVVAGYNSTKFGVGDELTREQLATILYRYAQKKGCNMSVSSASMNKLKGFSDYSKSSSYARTALAWALQNGVIGGLNETTLGANRTANRAQVAQILMNISKNKVIPF